MKKCIVLLILVILSSSNSFSQDITVKAKSMLRSKYIGPDGIVFYDKPVSQSDVMISHKSGFYANIWISSGLNTSWSTDWDDEADYTLGWNHNLGKFNLDASLSYFDNFKVFSCAYNDVLKSNITIAMKRTLNKYLSFSPFAEYTNYYIVDNKTPFGGGNMVGIGTGLEYEVTKVLFLSTVAKGIYDSGAFDVDNGMFVNIASELNLELGSTVTWKVIEAALYLPLKGREAPNSLALGTGLIFEF